MIRGKLNWNWLKFYGERNTGSPAITAPRLQTMRQTLTTSKQSIEFTFSDFPCHFKVNSDKPALTFRWWKRKTGKRLTITANVLERNLGTALSGKKNPARGRYSKKLSRSRARDKPIRFEDLGIRPAQMLEKKNKRGFFDDDVIFSVHLALQPNSRISFCEQNHSSRLGAPRETRPRTLQIISPTLWGLNHAQSFNIYSYTLVHHFDGTKLGNKVSLIPQMKLKILLSKELRHG